MALNYDEMVKLIGTIDDCFMMDEDGHCQIEVLSKQENQLRILRKLSHGYLAITLGDAGGTCEYVRQQQGLMTIEKAIASSATHVKKMEFDTEESLENTIDSITSKIREIVKADMQYARQISTASK